MACVTRSAGCTSAARCGPAGGRSTGARASSAASCARSMKALRDQKMMKSLIKPKVAHWKGGEPISGTRKGTAVAMDDGWRGRVEAVRGDYVICIQDGERPNDWLRGYRAFSRRLMSINGTKAIVNWKSAT